MCLKEMKIVQNKWAVEWNRLLVIAELSSQTLEHTGI